MNWRNYSPQWLDRLFASIVYLVPLTDALGFGGYLFRQFPPLSLITVPLFPLIIINSIPFGGFILFILLFVAVVRNTRISHFIRFNTMQAILMDILLILIGLVFRYLVGGLGFSLITETLANTVFLGTLVACVYAMVQAASGKYPEIPAISSAAHSQVPW
ncbi:MAG: hypothetical protein NZ901_09055 [Geminocystis sp.]|nr:hypothetical protein [Geminocystis sp.]HIK38114.1 hypothetical protein [Geminocystis sp. M7585_C2015_104]MCS7148322.1 hypothetical protein [Geminocystis sp.]MCX8077736.1 hypothetical protein [Geminocystis sp.]MDW8116628.1 Tic20 family protein [Geminocystis sp.]